MPFQRCLGVPLVVPLDDDDFYDAEDLTTAIGDITPVQPHFNPISTPFQPHSNPVSTPFQSFFNLISTPFQPHFNPILTTINADFGLIKEAEVVVLRQRISSLEKELADPARHQPEWVWSAEAAGAFLTLIHADFTLRSR